MRYIYRFKKSNGIRVDNLVPVLQDSINREIDSIIRDQSRLVTMHNGTQVATSEGEFVYSFKAEIRSSVPPESPIYVHISGQKPAAGTWISQDDFDVLLSVKETIGERIDRAKVSIDLTFILKALRDRLNDTENSEVLTELSATTPKHVTFDQTKLEKSCRSLDDLHLPRNNAQEQAIRECLEHSVHFVWGPPGTGKTANLAQTCRSIVDQGEKVLVISQANGAVDVAALRIADALADSQLLHSGGVLRIGIPQMQEVRDRQNISAMGTLRRLHPELIAALERAEQERRELGKLLQGLPGDDELRKRLEAVRSDIGAIRQQIRDAETLLIGRARVIIATASKFALDDRIWGWKPDTVIIDETSMLGFPFVYAGAKQSQKRLLLFGDFRQLPPVCVSEEPQVREWLGRDAFDIAGIQQAVNQGRTDSRVTLLNTQYRMNREIGTIVSKFSYGGMLNTDDATHRITQLISASEPVPNSPIVIVDTSSAYTACMQERKKGSFSRLNITHGLIVLDTCKSMLSSGAKEIAVITPYRAQAKLLSHLIKSLNLDASVIAATIHRFQGAEKECVVLDLVDALPQERASRLTGTDPETATRLLNVAISRAKGKLVIVADVSFIQAYHTGRSPAAKLLQLVRDYPSTKPAFIASQHPDISWSENWFSAQVPMYIELQRITQADISLPKGLTPSRQVAAKLSEMSPRSRTEGESPARYEPFFLVQSNNTIMLGGRHEDSPIAILSGTVREAVERAIIGDGSNAALSFRRRRQN